MQGRVIFPEIFSLYVNDIQAPSLHIELVQYANYTALIATSKHPELLVKYLETHLSELEKWFRDWRVVFNVAKSPAVRLDEFRHLVTSGFSEKRFDGNINSNI
jgi:hypothetical protein